MRIWTFVFLLPILGLLTPPVIAEEIPTVPGGIVYCDAGSITYHDFATGQKTHLQVELPGFQPNGSWAISEDMRWLCWFSGGKCFLRNLALQDASAVAVKDFRITSVDTYAFSLEADHINNPTISPGDDTPQIAYASQMPCMSFLRANLGNEEIALLNSSSKAALSQNPVLRQLYFKRVPNTFNGVVRISVKTAEAVCYGNTAAWLPSVFPCSLIAEIGRGEKSIGCMPGWFTLDPDGEHEIIRGVPGTQIPANALVRRDAYFPAWQKASSFQNNEGMLALVYKTPKGWGPIEIRQCQASRFGNVALDRRSMPRFWQLLVSLNTCTGLAWRPDGSLSYVSADKVFVIPNTQMESGIKDSKVVTVEMRYPPAERVGGMNFPMPATGDSCTKAVNNAFTVRPTCFAQGIKGDKLYWVSDDTLLFRGNDKVLYSCTNGIIRTVLKDIPPGEFFYCGSWSHIEYPPPQDDEIRKAVEWAQKQLDNKVYGPEWEYYAGCQKFVANSYGKPCPFYSYATAAEGAQRLNAAVNKDTAPPMGSWVFYTCKTDTRGHVALAVGDGFVIHASTNTAKEVATVRKDKYNHVPGADYVGWAWPQRKQ
jgi:hypothetical protein